MKSLNVISTMMLLASLLAAEPALAEWENHQHVLADAEIRLRFDVPTEHCRVRLHGSFGDTRGPHVAEFELDATVFNEGRWLTARGLMPIPRSSLLTFSVSLESVDPHSHCDPSDQEGQVWISHLQLTFDHPFRDIQVTRTIIGDAEVQWLTRSQAAMAYLPGDHSMRFETRGKANTRFFRPVDLLD